MRHCALFAAYLAAALVSLAFHLPAQANDAFSFGVIALPTGPDSSEIRLRDFLAESDGESFAFVVASGIKSADEPCSDKIYQARRTLLGAAKHGLIVSLTASDWAMCRNESGKSTAILKLNRLRDLLFFDEFSLGESRIPVTRQSTAAKFRAVTENARWEIQGVMFATVNLPANNNNYVYDAGRNSEFEDRLVANRAWLTRIFTFAKQKNAKAIVLFSDANPLAMRPGSAERRDGFAEIRKQLFALAAKFSGQVLLIHGQADHASGAGPIAWHGNLGQVGIDTGLLKITVDSATSDLFSRANGSPDQTHVGAIHSTKLKSDRDAPR